jgi:hypothetical protein
VIVTEAWRVVKREDSTKREFGKQNHKIQGWRREVGGERELPQDRG